MSSPLDRRRTADDERCFQDDACRKQRYRKAPKRMGDLIGMLMARKGYARVLAVSEFEAIWNKAAGERFAKHSRAGEASRGVLTITVRNSAVLQELTFGKRKLLESLKQAAPERKIRDLKFRVGEID